MTLYEIYTKVPAWELVTGVFAVLVILSLLNLIWRTIELYDRD